MTEPTFTDDQLAEGRRLVADHDQSAWGLGDLALAVAGPPPAPGQHDPEGSAVLDAFAEEIGIAAKTIAEQRRLAAKWPAEERIEGASRTLHRTVVNRENRGEVLADFLAVCKAEGVNPTRDRLADVLRSETEQVDQWSVEEHELRKKLEDGQTVVVNMKRHPYLWAWAEKNGHAVKIDRKTVWGNPFVLDDDGDRKTVIASYRKYYLPHKPSLDPTTLKGKALGCWCSPEACHGDVLAGVTR